MTPERWRRIEDVFEQALEHAPDSRAAFLTAACAGDEPLRLEVEALIHAHEGAEATMPAVRIAVAPGDVATATMGALAAGSRLGRYEIGALIGAGGMGEVYHAHDPRLGRSVAIKIVRGRDSITPAQMARFEREARAVGALNHPNILTVFDVGTADGIPFVVSELLTGETLRERLRRRPLPIDEVIAIARQIASGLAAAHEKGIVHRDIKPANLFVTADGVVKILDFGLARHDAILDADESSMTAQGFVMGTVGYMSPEQVRGERADARADVFAFGAVLYEMLAGRRAFQGDSAVETMHAILNIDPPVLRADLSQPLQAIVERCLDKTAAGRFDSMREVAALLGEGGSTMTAGRRGRPSTRALAIGAAMVGAMTIAAVMLTSWFDRAPSRGVSGRPALAMMPLVNHTDDPGLGWLSDGIPRMLMTSLAQTPGLDVIGYERLDASRRELEIEAGEDRRSRLEVARHAGAGTVLAGGFFKVGTATRVDIQVEDVATGQVVASGSEQGEDVFAIVDSLSDRIRAALDVDGPAARRPLKDVTTNSLVAYKLYVSGLSAWHNRRWSDARTLFEEAVRADPTFALAHAQLAIVLQRLGDAATAAKHRQAVVDHIDRLPERQRLLTEAKRESETNTARAIELLEAFLARYPDEEEAYDLMVHAYTASRDPVVSKRILGFMERWARALPGPGSGHFHNHYGYALSDQGLFTEAEREFRAYIRVSPDEANPHDSLAELFLSTGRPELAVESYNHALRINPLFGPSYFGRAYAQAMLGSYDEAIASLTKLEEIATRSGLPPQQILLTSALFRSRLGRYRETDGYLQRVSAQARETRDVVGETDSHLMRAVFAMERGHHAAALQAVEQVAEAAKHLPDISGRRRRLALAGFIGGLAKVQMRQRAGLAASASSDRVEAAWQHALAGEVALLGRDYATAEREFRASEYGVPPNFGTNMAFVALVNNLPFRDGLARVIAAQGDREGAIDHYRRLNKPDVAAKWTSILEPRFVLAMARLAAAAGDRQTARAEYRRFLELWKNADPGLPELAEARAYARAP
jgi:tetratricopeptide (TPR) repeat protein